MLNRYLTYYRPGLQMVVFLALLSMSWFVGAFVLSWIQERLLGMDAETWQSLREIPANLITPFKWTEALALFLLLLLPAMLFAYLAYPGPGLYLRLKGSTGAGTTPVFLLLLLLALPFSGLLEQWNAGMAVAPGLKAMDERYTTLANAMLSGSAYGDLALNLLVLVLVPAFVEEIFFRGCLQQILLQWMPARHWLALLAGAAVFSAFHGQMSAFLPRMFLGLLLGLAVYWSGSLWPSVAMHALNNALTVVLFFLHARGWMKTDIRNLPEVPVWLGLLSAALTAGLLYLLHARRRPWTVLQLVDRPAQTQGPDNEQTEINDEYNG